MSTMQNRVDQAIRSIGSALEAMREPASQVKDDLIERSAKVRSRLADSLDDAIKSLKDSGAKEKALIQSRRFASSTSSAVTRHPYVTVGLIGGVCYLIARKFRSRPHAQVAKARTATPAVKRARRPAKAAASRPSRAAAANNKEVADPVES
jgi:ElaB/YqjD/DUF883 family membrane-anchored ribosome-binding protein